MHHQKAMGWALFAIIGSSCILTTFAYPQQALQQSQISQSRPQPQYYANPNTDSNRKFAEKPNAMKKVALDPIDDIDTNEIQEGFSWSNMLATIMQMIFNVKATGPNKSDNIDTDTGVAPSPWANLFSMGLKILTAILGGGASNDGIDKVDNGSPMQSILAAVLSAVLGTKDPDQVSTMAKQAGEFINIVVNLLDALKTSFSHRSLAARSLGRKDSISDASIAVITMLKSYTKSFGTTDDICLQKYACEASTECRSDVGPSSIFCKFGSYATSLMFERQSATGFDQYYEAGRRGRSGVDCRQMYLQCNEV